MREQQSKGDDVSLVQFASPDDSTEVLAQQIHKLNTNIADKKAQLAPVIKDLRPLRQRCQDLQHEYETSKVAYDTTAAGLESAMSKLQQEVKKSEAEAAKLESQEFRAKCELEVLAAYEQLLQDEMKCFVASDGDIKEKSLQ